MKEKAIEKINNELKEEMSGKVGAIAPAVAEQLKSFCGQSPEFAAAVAEKAETLKDCCKKLEISKNGDATTFKYLFEECQGRFNKMLDFLDGIKESDGDTYNKLLAAVRALISQMEGALGNEN